MYLRPVHVEPHIPTLRSFIQQNPLGIITTYIPSQTQTFPSLQCTHAPWIMDISDASSESELPRLRGHIARNNPHAKAIIQASGNDGKGTWELEEEVMVLFNGPVQHYVTPKFYVETKPETGKVVPTWDYSAVQCYGKAKFYLTGEETSQFLGQQVRDLTDANEKSFPGRNNSEDEVWKVDDAPEKYIELLKKAIIGIEIEVTRLEGKWKMSQELSEGDRKGVIQGFEKIGTEDGLCMANTVRERGEKATGTR
ncbi:transcriptional regulator PAI 2-type [Flagelloscypha sp. PMI_526]|nr:transcriptional regulator PAI 2-type [Flagelloscypha sp. PMI_526]